MNQIILDSADKEILRLLVSAKRPLCGYAISSAIGLSAPSTNIRLSRLKEKGILRISSSSKHRTYTRNFKTRDGFRSAKISSPAKKLWEIDFTEAAK
ncbi:MAG: winged helix-turn-helix transcriptional regulator [Nanoarchaeota archaeon]|nr:MAG: winged helix-turn-helix transcriptional regulator [Nanoarchaeota archaeon]